MTYGAFRSGLTFRAIRAELKAEQVAAAARDQRMYVTRRTVLGRWRQRKRELWRLHQLSKGQGETG